MQKPEHNRTFRRISRRIPFGAYWWVMALWYLLISVLTPLSLFVWLQPGGPTSVLGIVLRWLWAATAAIKTAQCAFVLLVGRMARVRLGRTVAVSQMAPHAAVGLASFLALAFNQLEVAIGLIYVYGALIHSHWAVKKRSGDQVVLASLCAVTAIAFTQRVPWLAWPAAASICATEGVTAFLKAHSSLVKRSLRKALSGKLSRIEYGATALESCPIGGG
jgi:hypothetical protein